MYRLKLQFKHLFKEEIEHKDKHYGYQDKVSRGFTGESVQKVAVNHSSFICSLMSDCFMINTEKKKYKFMLKKL